MNKRWAIVSGIVSVLLILFLPLTYGAGGTCSCTTTHGCDITNNCDSGYVPKCGGTLRDNFCSSCACVVTPPPVTNIIPLYGPNVCSLNPIPSIANLVPGGIYAQDSSKGALLKIYYRAYGEYNYSAAGDTKYVAFTEIYTKFLTSQAAYLTIYQYDASGNILPPKKVLGASTTLDYFDVGSVIYNSGWTTINKTFETEHGTTIIRVFPQNYDASAAGYSLFGPIYIGARSDCKEYDCNDGLDNDYDGQVDMNDPDCYDMTLAGSQANINFWDSSAYSSIKTLAEYNPSAKNGNDGVCGDDNWLNGDFERASDYTTCVNNDLDINGWNSGSDLLSRYTTNSDFTASGYCALNVTVATPNGDWQFVNSSLFSYTSGNYVISGDIYVTQAVAPGVQYVQLGLYVYESSDGSGPGDLSFVTVKVDKATKGFVHVIDPIWSGTMYNSARIVIGLYNFNKGSSVYFDNIRFEKAPAGKYNPYDAMIDYGYIPKNNPQYMCYVYPTATADPKTEEKYTWLSAATGGYDTAFKIITLQTPNGATDVISNSENWYYCNATGKEDAGGIAVPEYNSYAAIAPITGSTTCTGFMKLVTGDKSWAVCNSPPTNKPCCMEDNPFDIADAAEQFDGSCQCYKDDASGLDEFCKLFPNAPSCTSGIGNPGSGFDSNDINRLLCGFDLEGCMNGTLYNPLKSCKDQLNGYGQECNPDISICKALWVVTPYSKDGANNCCFGSPKKDRCVTIPIIETADNCTEKGGTVYSDSTQRCTGTSIEISSSSKCCFGILYDNFGSIISNLGGTNNKTFICYKNDGQSVFSECCSGSECENIHLFNYNPAYVEYSAGRVTSPGSRLHVAASFNGDSDGTIVEMARQLVFKTKSTTYASISVHNSESMSGFSYLELDLAYSDESISHIFINGIDVGNITSFSINGYAPMRWHHLVINLSESLKVQKLMNISLSRIPSDVPTTFIVDNIVLVPSGTDLSTNSKDYYCAAGYNEWISDLDPPSTVDFNNVDSYGPYMATCDQQPSFKWTGTKCCGDDTRIDNYGEFFSDKNAGCFNATIIFNDSTVAYSKGYVEGANPQGFESYTYKDILFYNGEYYSCQNDYDSLKVSFDASTVLQTSSLISQKKFNECTVVGSYYCSNNAWRQYIPGFNTYDPATKTFTRSFTEELTNPQIALKSAPPGGELIVNGDFGGDAPPSGHGGLSS